MSQASLSHTGSACSRRLTVVGLSIFVALTSAACAGGGGGGAGEEEEPGQQAEATEEPEYADGGTLTMAIGQDPGVLDPQLSALAVTRAVGRFAYDTLLYTDADGELVSGLAEEWETTPTEVTYTLREGITCADGTPLTATDVAENFTFVSDPENASPLIGVTAPAGLTATADDEARTVTLTTAEPTPFLLETTAQLLIVCAKGNADRTSLNSETQGTGPYVLTESVENDHYTFTKREDYAWGPGGATNDEPGIPDQVVLRVIANPSTAINLLLGGEVQIAQAGDAEARRAEEAALVGAGNAAPFGELWFNQAEGHPGADQEVREALVGVLDEETIGSVLAGDLGAPSEGMLTVEPRICDGNTVEGNLPEMSVEEAGALLDSAGWTLGADGARTKDGTPLAFTFLAPASLGDNGVPATELLAQSWEELGATVEISSPTDTAAQTALFETGDWDAGFIALTVNLPTQYAGFVSGPTPPDGANFAHIDNPEYQTAAAAATALVGKEACEQYEAAEAELIRDADVAPLVNKLSMFYANGAEFRLSREGLVPQSLRLLAG